MTPKRVTYQDKWIIGGDGTWKDLLVVSPYVKLSLDAIGALFHPRKHYVAKKVTIAFLVFMLTYVTTLGDLISATLNTVAVVIVMQLATRLFRYTRTNVRNYVYTHRHQANVPFVPLDHTGDPRSAILLTRHVLIGGDSGTGKSNAVWMIIQGLVKYEIPFRLSVIDPAGGVELSDLQDAAYTIDYVDRPADADQLISQFRDRMNARLARLKAAHIRQFDPRKPLPGDDNNWHYLVIDEILLCAAQIKQGALSPLGDILSVGRKAGYIVIGCTQLSQKSTLGDFRDLFPQRVAFGTKTHEMTDAILGTSASITAPAHFLRRVGEGFLYNDKARGYYLFRTRHITDTQAIAQAPVKVTFDDDTTDPNLKLTK